MAEPIPFDLGAYAAALPWPKRAEEAARLDALFRTASGHEPTLWSGRMVGYGAYDYTYKSGRSGTSLATGWALSKAKISVYIMPGYTDFGDILGRLGKHSKGKSCLYLNKLEDVDSSVLAELVRAGLEDLNGIWPVRAV
ncbi:MAG: DUF1801 domain-containing protein [Pseudomonadota bacterium]